MYPPGAVEVDPATVAAAWRLLEAGDTLCISQVESVGFRMMLKRARELATLQSQHDQALHSIEDLAQLLAIWKPGVYSKEREEAYFDARFAARTRPTYPHPAMASVLDPTAGLVVYADQLVELVKLLGFDHAWAERFRRALAGGRLAGRDVMERAIREAGARHRWTAEQSNALLNLLLQYVGYLHPHGHALSMAQHVFRQACLKVNPSTAPIFFAEALNNGGSIQYGLGSAVEEARRFGVLLLPPCVNASSDRFTVEDSSNTLVEAQGKGRGTVGAIRVPARPVQPQHLELLRRLHESGDASSLILQFGPHKGSTLAQVAISNPDYVRQLVTRAQRPDVRAAAGRLVSALDPAAARKPHPARGTHRGAGPA